MDGNLQQMALQLFQDSAVQLGFLAGTLLLLIYRAKVRPSGLAFALILMPVPFLLLGFYWPIAGWVFNLYNPVLMLVLLVDAFVLSILPEQLDVSRNLSEKFLLGQGNRVLVTVHNRGSRPLWGKIRDGIPPDMHLSPNTPPVEQRLAIPPFASQVIEYDLVPEKRGKYAFGLVHLRYRSRWGLLWLTAAKGRPESVMVYPDLRRIQSLRVRYAPGMNAGELRKKSLGMEGTEFRGLRPYYAGDDVRKVAWTATARLDVPVVRAFDMAVEQPVMVLLDAGRKMQASLGERGVTLHRFDWALNAALAFTSVAISRGDCVGASVFGQDILAQVPVGMGRQHFNLILETLSGVQPEPAEPAWEKVMPTVSRQLKWRSLVVLFTEVIDPHASRSLLRSLQGLARQHLVLVVTLQDAMLTETARQMPEEVADVWRKGVAHDLLALREEALLPLRSHPRIVVIDAPPRQLDEALINRYLEIKRNSPVVR